MSYLINCEYFNNLNENGDMAGTSIMAGICTSPYPSSYPTEKVGNSPYPYPYPVNSGISRQNGDGFGQYPRGRVYLSSLTVLTQLRKVVREEKEARHTIYTGSIQGESTFSLLLSNTLRRISLNRKDPRITSTPM